MIEIKSVTKKFDDFTAIDNMSFSVGNSSIYGLIGYNGAGKTTLLKTAAGIYKADGGEILLNGSDPYDNDKVRKTMFFVPDDLYFLPGATVRSMGAFYKKMYQSFDAALFEKLLNLFSLPENKKLKSFSKGMKRQAEIVFALASRPEILLLDEVFDGVDPQKRDICKNLLLEYIMDTECSVIISSHSLSELSNLCDHIGLINGKKLSIDCAIDDIPLFNKKFKVVFSENANYELLSSLPLKELKTEGNFAFFSVLGTENLKKVNQALQKLPVQSTEPTPMTLEEVFLCEMGNDNQKIENIFTKS